MPQLPHPQQPLGLCPKSVTPFLGKAWGFSGVRLWGDRHQDAVGSWGPKLAPG